MGTKEQDLPEIVKAAQALEAELAGLETLSRAVRKIPLNSDKNLGRAVKELNLALSLPERLAEGLRGVAVAMERMQARQQAALEPLAEAARAIQERSTLLGAYMDRFGELGGRAKDLVGVLQANGGDLKSVADDVEKTLSRIATDAKSLAEDATKDDFPDVTREADALKQRVTALRGRLARS